MYNFKKGFYADVRIEDRFATQIELQNGQLHEAKETQVKKAFIRVFDGQMWYYTSTTDVQNVQQALDDLYLYAQPNEEIQSNPVVQRYQVNKDCKTLFADRCTKNVPFQQKYALVTDIAQKLNSPLCNFTNVVYLDRYSHYEFYSSKGAEIKHDYQNCGLAFSMAFSHNGESLQETMPKGGPYFEDIVFTDEEIAEFISRCEYFIQNAEPVVAGSYPVVLAPYVTGIFAHESFGHKSEADFMLGDENMAKEWQLGKKVASDILTIRETGAIVGGGYVPYDDEGTKASDTYLIKKGVLSGRLHSTTTAAVLGEEPTGNARAINCDYEPIVRMTNTFIEGGESTLEQLLAPIEKGYYVLSPKHGSGMSTFTIAPSLAYEIVNGKIGKPVKIAVLTGNVFETLGLIDGVGNDMRLLPTVGGGCGKMEQFPLAVGMGGPHIRVSKMNVQ